MTDLWTVKDVLAHLVGWEREVALEFKKMWGTDIEPWFTITDDYNDFKRKIYEEFKNFTPEELLLELEKWQAVVAKEIDRVGEDKIR